ncbi:MAG: hypothetical protein IPH54_06595 [Rhodoferax sp.]|nr:hypothetical protein [Rhodoferax sp.]
MDTVSDKPRQFEVIWDDRDHESWRVATDWRVKTCAGRIKRARSGDWVRGKVLAVLTLVIWKTTKWVAQAQAAANQPTIDWEWFDNRLVHLTLNHPLPSR